MQAYNTGSPPPRSVCPCVRVCQMLPPLPLPLPRQAHLLPTEFFCFWKPKNEKQNFSSHSSDPDVHFLEPVTRLQAGTRTAWARGHEAFSHTAGL